jgi:sterol desaturase/sphingolipid hydroxylase (fatty acid hydroxylase superfamily)
MSEEAWIRLSMFVGILMVMAIWELLAPRRVLTQGYRRWPANLGIVVLNGLLVRFLPSVSVVGTSLWAAENGWGLLNLVALPDMTTIAIAVILLDLTIYLQHVMVHAVPLFWRLHMVHHADRDIDVTTGLRFHPIEIILSVLIKVAAVVLIGAPYVAVVIFEVVLNGMAMFNHGNVKLPEKIDAVIRALFVTPDMHRVHHSVIKRETNSNYGFNLSIWDRIFGTYTAQPEEGHTGMTIGLNQFQAEPTHNLFWMLRLPFGGEIGQYPIMRAQKREEERNE